MIPKLFKDGNMEICKLVKIKANVIFDKKIAHITFNLILKKITVNLSTI